MNEFVYVLFLVLNFLITFVLTKIIIKFMRKKRVGQSILADGPSWHLGKSGTPTMGGISFLISCTACYLIFVFILACKNEIELIQDSFSVYIYAILNGVIGLLDDFKKAHKKQNKGLSAKSKFLLQSVAAVIFLILLFKFGKISTVINIPLLNISFDMGVFYYVLVFFVLCGFVNAVNLTDGIDGLASAVSLTVGILFSVASLISIKNEAVSFFAAMIVGSTVAFLIFNRHPAKIFMGDTGSLYLGGIIVAFAVIMNKPLIVILYGIMFFIEAISVILQVLYFKITKGKRLFKMAPFHHHLEKCGWSENKIVLIFSLINAVFCSITFFLL